MLAQMTIRNKVLLMTGLLMLGLLVQAGFVQSSVEKIRIHGPVYSEIRAHEKLISDTLPRPALVLDAYFIVHALLEQSDPGKRAALLGRILDLRRDYEE